MGMHAVSKLLASITLFLLTVYHTSHHWTLSLAEPLSSQLTDPKKDGYSRLVRYIKRHPIARDKIPPTVNGLFCNTKIKEHETDDSIVHDDVADDVAADNGTMSVHLSFHPVDVISLDVLHQILEMSAYLMVSWEEPGLAWNSSDYGGVENVELDLSDLWTPTLTVANGVRDNDLIPSRATLLNLARTGRALVLFSANLKTFCPLNVRLFPFDTQTCELFISSNRPCGGSHELILQDDFAFILRNVSAGGEWDLMNVRSETFAWLPGHKNKTRVVLTLRRKVAFYVTTMGLPMALFSYMNCFVFLIPPENGEKVSFLVSLFISNAVLSSSLAEILPRGIDNVDKVPVVLTLMMFMWIWSTVVFIATIYVIRTYLNEEKEKQARLVVRDQDGRKDTTAGASASYNTDHSQQQASSESFVSLLCSCLPNQGQGKQLTVKDKANGVVPLGDVRGSNDQSVTAERSTGPVEDVFVEDNVGQTSAYPRSSSRRSGDRHVQLSAKSLDRLFFGLSCFVVVLMHIYVTCTVVFAWY